MIYRGIEFPHDPDFPILVLDDSTNVVKGKFPDTKGAAVFLYAMEPNGIGHYTMDTTPAPRIPLDADAITWRNSEGGRLYASRYNSGEREWVYGYGARMTEDALLGCLGDSDITPLYLNKGV